jgi:hypothetical protein
MIDWDIRSDGRRIPVQQSDSTLTDPEHEAGAFRFQDHSALLVAEYDFVDDFQVPDPTARSHLHTTYDPCNDEDRGEYDK